MIRLEWLILKNQELVWFLSIVLNRVYFNACLPAGRRGKCFYPCISGMGTNIQRGWIMGSPAPTHRGPGNSLDAQWGPFPPIQAGGSRAWALKCPSRESQELSCWGCPMQERTPLSGNEVVLSRGLGAALHQPTGIEQENDPTGLTTHLRAEIQHNMAAFGLSSIHLSCPRAHQPQALCTTRESSPLITVLAPLNFLSWFLLWLEGQMMWMLIQGTSYHPGAWQALVWLGQYFSFHERQGQGLLIKGQRLLLQPFLRVLWRPWLNERTPKSCLVMGLDIRFLKVCFISKVDILHYRWVRKPGFEHG